MHKNLRFEWDQEPLLCGCIRESGGNSYQKLRAWQSLHSSVPKGISWQTWDSLDFFSISFQLTNLYLHFFKWSHELSWLVPIPAVNRDSQLLCHFSHLYRAECQLLSGKTTTTCVTFWARWLKWPGFKWPIVQEGKNAGVFCNKLIFTWHGERNVQ